MGSFRICSVEKSSNIFAEQMWELVPCKGVVVCKPTALKPTGCIQEGTSCRAQL